MPGLYGDISITNVYISGYFGSELSHEVGPQYNFENILKSNESSSLPKSFHLYPSFPNPFNPIITIPFHISNDQVLDLDIYNINGKNIQSILKNAEFHRGKHQIEWNAGKWSSGLYFIQLKNKKNIFTQKIMLMK